MVKKLSTHKLKELIVDETMASREYKQLGLPNFARDEAKHEFFLRKILKNRRKK